MRVDDVLNVRAPVQKLVALDVGIVVGLPSLFPVVRLREKARRSQDQTRQTARAVEQLAPVPKNIYGVTKMAAENLPVTRMVIA